MYLYGFKKRNNLTTNVMGFFELLVNELDVLTYSPGRNSYKFKDYFFHTNNMYEEIDFIEEMIIGKELDTRIKIAIRSLSKEDLECLEKYKETLRKEFFEKFYSLEGMIMEDFDAECFVVKANGNYFQLVACIPNRPKENETYTLYFYDDKLYFSTFEETKFSKKEDVIAYIINTYDIPRGVNMQVLSSNVSSPTKSKKLGNLFVIDETHELIRNGERATTLDHTYIIKKHANLYDYYISSPMRNGKKLYANSGNFITSSNCLFDFLYAIPIFDYEVK